MKTKEVNLIKKAEEELEKIKEVAYKDIILDQVEQKSIVKWLVSFIEIVSRFELSKYNYKRFLEQIKNPIADIRWIITNAEAMVDYIKENPNMKKSES
ncbi:MAG: hypothetical protein M1409_07930 [Actinobacteria bacterium]|nr:hypothetical protein [Actinomycetota bacterium]